MISNTILETISTRLDASTLNLLRATAVQQELTKTEVIRRAVREYLEFHKNAQSATSNQDTQNPQT